MSDIKAIEKLREIAEKLDNAAARMSEHGFSPIAVKTSLLCDEIEAEISERYMLLPVDADGVPIHVGDKVRFRNDSPITVDSIGTSRVCESDWGFFVSNGELYGQGTMKNVHHVKPRTLEDVLADFAADVENDRNTIETARKYADEIRELFDVAHAMQLVADEGMA